jgi:hypothetical protein
MQWAGGRDVRWRQVMAPAITAAVSMSGAEPAAPVRCTPAMHAQASLRKPGLAAHRQPRAGGFGANVRPSNHCAQQGRRGSAAREHPPAYPKHIGLGRQAQVIHPSQLFTLFATRTLSGIAARVAGARRTLSPPAVPPPFTQPSTSHFPVPHGNPFGQRSRPSRPPADTLPLTHFLSPREPFRLPTATVSRCCRCALRPLRPPPAERLLRKLALSPEVRQRAAGCGPPADAPPARCARRLA